MPVTCPNCNHSNRDGARFCAACRTALPASLGPMSGLTGMLPTNTLLAGRYLIVRKIGQGGMAAVYLVADTRLAGKQWAVKEMSDAAISDPVQKQYATIMFQQEMQLLTRLHHRNIPQVMDTFVEGGKHFIVMEYVDGLTLEEALRRQGGHPCPESQVRPWLCQLCDVLDYLHAQTPPIIFRDLKPGNIMVDRSGTIKLIDFGIARLFSPQKTHDTLLFGTFGYAAPEQYSKQAQSDARSDVYGLGATLYHLLTGYDPSTTPMTLPPLEQFHVQVSPTLRRAVQRALEHDRDRRWQSVREMAGAMGIQMASHAPAGPVVAGGPSTPASLPPRPTTRLLLAMARMSTKQLAGLAGALAVFFALVTVLVAPHISLELAMAFPLYLMAGPLAHAASHRRWAMASAHLAVTGVVWLVANNWVDIGDDLALFAVGLLLSSLVMEAIPYLREKQWPASSQAPWWHDCAWLAGTTAVGGLIAFGVPSIWGYYNWLRPWLPVGAALFGALGWFLGDLYHQNVLLKQSAPTSSGH